MLTTGQRIKQIRKSRRLTLEKLSDIIGCHPTAVAYWESDRNLPRGDNLVKLASALDVSVVELLYGKECEHGKPATPRK